MTSRTVLITGAAAGIGRASAQTLATRGWTVAAMDRDAEGLAILAEEAELNGVDIRTATLDVTDAEQFAARVSEVVGSTGRLDALVNNAGLLRAGRFEDIDVREHQREIDVNVVGVLNGLHAGFDHLRRTAADHGGATVVNLGSASAIYGQAELAGYSATKFYVRGLTEALDIEWAHHGIRVVDLWPLFVGTGMLDGVSIGTTTSLGVKLTAQDVADALVDVLDPSARARALRQVHFPVGVQSKAMALGSRFSPAWLTRGVNRRLAGH
jgi:NADP-dependent 3-hydroxy acid dehydrogenase YdfG